MRQIEDLGVNIRKKPTVTDLQALKGKKQLTMLRQAYDELKSAQVRRMIDPKLDGAGRGGDSLMMLEPSYPPMRISRYVLVVGGRSVQGL